MSRLVYLYPASNIEREHPASVLQPNAVQGIPTAKVVYPVRLETCSELCTTCHTLAGCDTLPIVWGEHSASMLYNPILYRACYITKVVHPVRHEKVLEHCSTCNTLAGCDTLPMVRGRHHASVPPITSMFFVRSSSYYIWYKCA